MFFADSLRVPPLVGPLKVVKGAGMKKKEEEQFSPEEAQSRFEAALRGARLVGPRPLKSLSPKPKVAGRKPGKGGKPLRHEH